MAVCKQCGASVENGVGACPYCGAPITGGTTGGFQGGTVNTPAFNPMNTQQPSMNLTPEQDAQMNKTQAILAYIFFFVPLLSGAHKTSPFVRYHTNQGIILVLTSVAYSIASSILRSISYTISYSFGRTFSSILSFGNFAILALCVVGIINAVKGEKKPLPVVGGITILK